MRHRIDPKVDCVFKALLGAEPNRNLLAHFLNAVLANELSAPITAVDILNPYSDPESLDDKLSIVDVKAEDQQGRIYQIGNRSLPSPACGRGVGGEGFGKRTGLSPLVFFQKKSRGIA